MKLNLGISAMLTVAVLAGAAGGAVALSAAAGGPPTPVYAQQAGAQGPATEETPVPVAAATAEPEPEDDAAEEPATAAEPADTVTPPTAGPDDTAAEPPVAATPKPAPKKPATSSAEEDPAPAAPARELTVEEKALADAMASCLAWVEEQAVAQPDGRCDDQAQYYSQAKCLQGNEDRLAPGREQGQCVNGEFVPFPRTSTPITPLPDETAGPGSPLAPAD